MTYYNDYFIDPFTKERIFIGITDPFSPKINDNPIVNPINDNPIAISPVIPPIPIPPIETPKRNIVLSLDTNTLLIGIIIGYILSSFVEIKWK